ncbi:hypothetical protein [Natrialba chahannaoensis]|nr:hypothetical protein [Natrialba chahannaoensis]
MPTFFSALRRYRSVARQNVDEKHGVTSSAAPWRGFEGLLGPLAHSVRSR